MSGVPDGVRLGELLHRTGKSVVHAGTTDAGEPVVVKTITTDEPYWVRCRARELATCAAFAERPPGFVAPRVRYADERTTVYARLPGVRLHDRRHLDADLPPATVAAVRAAVRAVAAWSPPGGTAWSALDGDPAPDPSATIAAEHANGLLSDGERDALHRLADRLGPARAFAHGDPIPTNILLHDGAAVLVDWELSGPRLPGYDWAVLFVTGAAASPALAAAVLAETDRAELRDAFTVNLGLLLCREIRIHRDLPAPAGLDRLRALWRRRLTAGGS
ncbi:phosphotransferase [Dactylosporangium aurantiacum]|uniref:Phosphotransferase n=1 Tax=Dactylosporangium aurantiacum TaxID=35754 RepID=A0A9Q9MGN8_9ACTN|nr:phosphotransferase [Dactylosporangium aurantiacum]MDG6105485.1 phosphotransferase [Dactylosporangium aurantiacum]UWZ53980.1 phosphotransferase [Dactylosporangium aurantiacum]